jgi:hypothetical protein
MTLVSLQKKKIDHYYRVDMINREKKSDTKEGKKAPYVNMTIQEIGKGYRKGLRVKTETKTVLKNRVQ